ncbi:MAG: MmgE/PrpD family protein [Thermodesulfobacteriota bacterium]
MDMIYTLADHVVNTNFNTLPDEVIEKTKLFLLDTLGVALPGSGAPGVAPVAKLMAEIGGKKQSTVLCYGHKLPAMNAALVNSMMIHALDLDDLHDDAIVHPSCCQFPVALAMAEASAPVDGKKLIAAVALGVDISCRLALGLISGMGFIRSGICGIFGAVATAAKLRNFNQDQIVNAMGIAYSQTAANAQVLLDGALVKRMQPAFMAKNGIFSVLLAERGIEGPKNILQGKFGFLELYKRGEVFPEKITENLGKVYETANVDIKPFPGGRYIHGPAELGIALATQHDLKPEQIAEVTIYLPQMAYNYVGRPYDPTLGNPQVMAQFCAVYAGVAGIVRREFFIGEMEETVIKDPVIAGLAKKTKVLVDEAVKSPTAKTPVTMEIRTRDGKVFKEKVQYLKGHPKNFLTKEEIIAKFRKCVDLSAVKIPGANLKKIVSLTDKLEKVADVSVIPGLLTKAK